MSLPSVELTALLVSNKRLTSAVVACCVAIGLLVGACCYLAYRSNRIHYTTVSSGVTLSLPSELDEQTLRNFAEAVVSRLGNVTPAEQTPSTHLLHQCGINSTLFRTGVGGQRYAVCTSSKSHNCWAGKGSRVWRIIGLG